MDIVIFGCGRAGKIHIKNILNDERFNIKYIVDPVVNQLNLNNIDLSEKIITDESIVWKDNNIKMVIIASPTIFHYQLIKDSLNNNKNVLVEKPVSSNKEEIIECYNLAKNKNLVLLAAFNRRFDPSLIDVKNRIDNGEIGKVNYALTISRDYPCPTDEYLKISSGLFHDCGVHDIDYLNWILNDKPISVYVTADKESDSKLCEYNFKHVNVILEYKNLIASLNLSRISQSYDQRCEFYGDKGEIRITKYDPSKKESFPEKYYQSYINELDHFYKIVNNDEKPKVNLDDNLNTFIIAEACEESYEKQSKIIINYK